MKNGHDVNGLTLVLSSEPLVRSGVTGKGRPWCVLEVSAREYGSASSSFYRLALWGSEEHNRALAPLLRPRMRVTVCGRAAKQDFTGRDGKERHVTRIEVRSAGLLLIQPGLRQFEVESASLPPSAPGAFELLNDSSTDKVPGPEQRNGMTVTLLRAVAQHGVTVPSEGPLAGSSCRALKLYASGPDGFYVLHTLQPAVTAGLIMQRLKPGTQLAVSGETRFTGLSAADGKTPLYDLSLTSFGLDLMQKGLKGIDFQVHPLQEGIPVSFKGSPDEWYYGRGTAVHPGAEQQVSGGMER